MEASMLKFINISNFMSYLFDDESQALKAAEIVRAILEAQSPRLSNVAEKMDGKTEANYKAIQRFISRADVKRQLQRLFQEEAQFVIGDPTEMPRYEAPKTSYVGTLSDEKTPGYWLLVLSTPFRGRAIPFHFITYSSKTIGAQATSRNQEHFRAFAEIKALLGNKPLVLDREFSYLELLERLVVEQIQFVIRLKLGDKRKPTHFVDADGQPVKLYVQPGQKVIYRNVFYLGVVKVNLIGYWRKGLSTPLWVMTSLEPEQGLQIYQARMKIDESFRDCKDLLHLPKVMNKRQDNLEKMIALALIAFVVGYLFGEAVRDVCYGKLQPEQVGDHLLNEDLDQVSANRKWQLYSGLFILLKQKPRLPDETLSFIAQSVAQLLPTLIYGPVRTFV
jgi:hypothetical protein